MHVKINVNYFIINREKKFHSYYFAFNSPHVKMFQEQMF